MKKRHFVLVEDKNYCNYPSLIRIKEYCQSCDGENKTSNQLADMLVEKGYTKITSTTNIILYKV